jgi:SAM-dependent methyltransferase
MEVQLINPFNGKELRQEGDSLRDSDGNVFPLKGGAYTILRDEENYSESFGFQWNKYQATQLDREKKSSQSRTRFFAATGWDKQNLTGQNILEVGSGAGRFSKVVLEETAANLYSVDYSNAVEANFRNNGHYARLKLFRASVYELPFKKNSFDKVFCFGVLQHTPDFRKSVRCLAEMVKPGGELVLDFYPVRGWYTKIHSKYLLRPFTKNMKHEKLLSLIEGNIDRLIKLHFFFCKAGVGKIFNRFLPVCDISNTFPATLSPQQVREWAVLDTFDMFSPRYDKPQKIETVKKWVEEYDLKVNFSGFINYDHNATVAVVKGVKL